MNAPVAVDSPPSPSSPPSRSPPARRRRRWIILGVALAVLLLLIAGGIASLKVIGGFIQDQARAPWAILEQVAFACKDDAQAAVFYSANPGLAPRYPTSAAYVAAARRFCPRLVGLFPSTPPDVWTMIKSGGGSMNISASGNRVEFSVSGYRGLTARLVTVDDAIVDLEIE